MRKNYTTDTIVFSSVFLLIVSLITAALLSLSASTQSFAAEAQIAPIASTCHAVANNAPPYAPYFAKPRLQNNLPQIISAAFGRPVQSRPIQNRPIESRKVQSQDAYTVSITYIGHSTFRIKSPQGVVIATDYNGYAGNGKTPDIVTMNHATPPITPPFPTLPFLMF